MLFLENIKSWNYENIKILGLQGASRSTYFNWLLSSRNFSLYSISNELNCVIATDIIWGIWAQSIQPFWCLIRKSEFATKTQFLYKYLGESLKIWKLEIIKVWKCRTIKHKSIKIWNHKNMKIWKHGSIKTRKCFFHNLDKRYFFTTIIQGPWHWIIQNINNVMTS